MPVQRSYNVWKTGIILTVKKYKEDENFPWYVLAISKTFWERDRVFLPLKVFSKFKTFEEAKESIPEIQKTIENHKFPR